MGIDAKLTKNHQISLPSQKKALPLQRKMGKPSAGLRLYRKDNQTHPKQQGVVLEWLKRHAWKACIRQKRIPSSNLGHSAGI